MGLIDQGGARMRERDRFGDSDLGKRLTDQQKAMKKVVQASPVVQAAPEMTVLVDVVETHDGVGCDCIPGDVQEMTLRVGDTVELTHTCHDGRVDKVTATIREINLPVEHTTVQVKRS